MPQLDTNSPPGRSGHVSQKRTVVPYFLFAGLALVPLVILVAFAYRVAAGSTEQLIVRNNASAAAISGAMVERMFGHLSNSLESFTRLPALSTAVVNGDEASARARLRVFVEAHPDVDRAFLTDITGLLWSDWPIAPESLGKRFDDRDWFQGLARDWQPYVSGVYQRHAEPRLNLVAIAMPYTRPETGEVIGALVCQIRLESVTRVLQNVEVGQDGYLFLMDHNGVVAAHPRLDLQQRLYNEYADSAPITEGANGNFQPVEYTDPIEHELMLATAVPVSIGGSRWYVVAQQPVHVAFQGVRGLARRLIGAGLLMALVVSILFFYLARVHHRVRRLNGKLRRAIDELDAEVRQRREAEDALKELNLNLEQTVQERTRELRAKEEQFLQSQKMEAVGRLAGGVAHDFNNLLSVILGFSELALKAMTADDPHRKEMRQIHEAGTRAANLTRQLLAFSRKQVMKLEIIDVNQAVQGMEAMLRRLIGENIDYITRPGQGRLMVSFDPGQLEQILMNLVINARDAMPKGGKLTVGTGAVDLDEDYVSRHADAQAGPHVVLEVTDTGHGMDAATKARIFEPFFTTKAFGRGTGLGLSTVYGIVKQSGGNIWVYSEPGRGTSFKVYLPRVSGGTPSARLPILPRSAPKGSGVILLVEDEPALRELVVQVLEMGGYTVYAAGDAAGARALWKQHGAEVRLLMTDVVLPDTGGPELARELSSLRPDLKVLFVSGYTENAIVHHGTLDPGINFLEKPLLPQPLLARIHEILAQ
jgi:signal transduction histidine kinase/CheY-like chemotaxis protein